LTGIPAARRSRNQPATVWLGTSWSTPVPHQVCSASPDPDCHYGSDPASQNIAFRRTLTP